MLLRTFSLILFTTLSLTIFGQESFRLKCPSTISPEDIINVEIEPVPPQTASLTWSVRGGKQVGAYKFVAGQPADNQVNISVGINNSDPKIETSASCSVKISSPEPSAGKLIAEIGEANRENLLLIFESLRTELANDPTARGNIINYGPDRKITYREEQIRQIIATLRIDPQRVTIVRGDVRPVIQSEFWIVPPGATDPVPRTPPGLVDAYGLQNFPGEVQRMSNFFTSLGNQPQDKGFYVFYRGKNLPGEAARRAHMMTAYLKDFMKYDTGRLSVIDGGFSDQSWFELYLVSPGTREPQTGTDKLVEPKTRLKFDEYPVYLPNSDEDTATGFSSDYLRLARLKDLAAQLKNFPQITTQIVFFIKQGDQTAGIREIAQKEKNTLVNELGIPANRIALVSGGRARERKIEIRLLPAR